MPTYVSLSEALRNLPLPVVKIRQLPHAKGLPWPEYKSDWAAGLDLCAAVPKEKDPSFILHPGSRIVVPTGLIMAIPKGYEGQVRPRSGLAVRQGITVLNAPGTIDADYRGEIKVVLINHGVHPRCITRGDRIAQLVIAPVTTVTLQIAHDLDETERGEGGFGSTGS